MVSDVDITLDSTVESFEVQQFDGQKVVRHNEPSSTVEQDLTVSHQETNSGITRSMARLDEQFENAQGEEELASAYIVLTHGSAAGKARALELSKGLTAWLTASSNANLVALSAKGYGA